MQTFSLHTPRVSTDEQILAHSFSKHEGIMHEFDLNDAHNWLSCRIASPCMLSCCSCMKPCSCTNSVPRTCVPHLDSNMFGLS